MLDIPSLPPDGADYVTVKRAIEFISKRYRDQPSIEAIAEHVGLSAARSGTRCSASFCKAHSKSA